MAAIVRFFWPPILPVPEHGPSSEQYKIILENIDTMFHRVATASICSGIGSILLKKSHPLLSANLKTFPIAYAIYLTEIAIFQLPCYSSYDWVQVETVGKSAYAMPIVNVVAGIFFFLPSLFRPSFSWQDKIVQIGYHFLCAGGISLILYRLIKKEIDKQR